MFQNNIRTITCDSCCEVAVEYDNDQICVSDLDGKVYPCQSCSVLGRVSYDYEYEHASVRFIALSAEEVSEVDFGVIVDGYEASQKKIDNLICEICDEQKKVAMRDERILELERQVADFRKFFERVA